MIQTPESDPERIHHTNAVWAYRYNGHFFRTTQLGHGDAHNVGQYLANRIPRDEAKREKWIKQIIQLIENELLWRAERGIPITDTIQPDVDEDKAFTWISRADIALDHPVNDRTRIAFMDIVPDYDLNWLCPDSLKKPWTYVIDLVDRAFTIDGILHFTFDRMPHSIPRCLVRPRTCFTYYQMSPKAEVLHSTFVQRWPPQLQRPSEDWVYAYSLISPIVTNLDEWGTRAWDELNASEALSAHLVATILHDQSTQIRNPDFLTERRMFNYCQWQLLTAAAPSALALLPSPIPSNVHSGSFHPGINITLDASNWSDPRMSFGFVARTGNARADGWNTPPMWFRGCLIVLCYRLDTPEFVMAEVYRMVQALEASHRNEGLGLIFDGRNVVGVALDNMHVRYSPALPIYNHQLRLTDGFRLVVHLLSPCLLSEKVPWRPSAPQPARSGLPLPMEIIVRITQLVDCDTYGVFPLVSSSFRRLYFTYPRFGNIILLQPAQLGAFHVYDTAEQQKYCGFFRRHPDSSFVFYHRQHKLGPIFFTPEEYTKSRNEFRKTAGRNVKTEVLLKCTGMTHIVRLGLQVLDKYTPDLNEPLIPEETKVSMQVVLGCWSLEKRGSLQGDEVWYRYHVARDSRPVNSDLDNGSYF